MQCMPCWQLAYINSCTPVHHMHTQNAHRQTWLRAHQPRRAVKERISERVIVDHIGRQQHAHLHVMHLLAVP